MFITIIMIAIFVVTIFTNGDMDDENVTQILHSLYEYITMGKLYLEWSPRSNVVYIELHPDGVVCSYLTTLGPYPC